MKKETIITTAIGIVMGVIVAFAVVVATKEKKAQNKKVIAPQNQPTVALKPTQEKKQPLTIETPSGEETVDKNTITIKGTVQKGALLIFQSPFAQQIIKTDDGAFSINFPLTVGQNPIKITAHIDDVVQEKTVTLFYFEKEQ